MGSFYTSHTLRGPSQQAVLAHMNERRAFVSREEDGNLTVLDEASECQDPQVLGALAQSLSAFFACPVLALLNHDDNFLYLELYENGAKTDQYNSNPAAFSEDDEDGFGVPQGGDAARLCAAFGAADVGAVEAVLRDESFMMAVERHERLAEALGLPAFSVGLGFTYAEANDGVPENCFVPSAAAA
ncbi:hypothetical protein [Massilia sp. CCM 8734]|uniref:hypothetical protein n=1 Tax=Massilia sp. CCM 8734 TaxID=2609283 RepID=UPI001423C74F|nr:hypothetical protein [Massilia sp. CCM 8734]NHZ98399.1 hypothetical protein [Massilia sp. CCM 8734]